ncbi:MAG: hypothetical protein JWO31_3135, partial [Phycisphaerales bacterium]|nr:hypothetical protein [Phycisphaerales bacterium]
APTGATRPAGTKPPAKPVNPQPKAPPAAGGGAGAKPTNGKGK